jgi:hypothetical protein
LSQSCGQPAEKWLQRHRAIEIRAKIIRKTLWLIERKQSVPRNGFEAAGIPISIVVESQGAFANRFATEMQSRLNIACPVSFLEQVEFGGPVVSIACLLALKR